MFRFLAAAATLSIVQDSSRAQPHCRRRSLLLLAVLISTLYACGGEPSSRPRFTDGGVAVRTITQERTTCTECIEFRRSMHIDIDSGPGMIDEARSVVRDGSGRLWVGTGRGIQVYSSEGQFIRTLGRRGDGPGEFRSPGPILAGRSGAVRFIDQTLYRESRFDSALHFVGVYGLPAGPIFDAVAIDADGDTLLVNAELFDADRVGYPAHVLAGGKILMSFAMPEDSMFDAFTEHMLRKVTVLPDGRFAVSKLYTYEIDLYSRKGERLLVVERPGLWAPPPGGVPRVLTREMELHGFVQDLSADAEGRLWVLSWEPRSDWRSNLVERALPDGTPFLSQKDSQSALRRSRIEVIDVSSGTLLATATHEAMLWGFVAPGKVYGYTYAPTDQPRLEVYDVSLMERR